MSDQTGFATREDFLTPGRRFKDTKLYNGKRVLIRSLSEGEWSKVEIENYSFDGSKSSWSKEGLRLSNVRIFIATICDANPESPTYKQPLFTLNDMKGLFETDAIMVEPLVKEIRDHCGLGRTTEDFLKNLGATTGDDSQSSSAGQSPTT